MAGGGLPQAQRDPSSAARRCAVERGCDIAPYAANGQRLRSTRSASVRGRAARRRSARWPSSTALSPGARAGAAPADQGTGRLAAAASPSARRARWSASIICRPARSSLARRGCRSARSGRRSSPSSPAARCVASARLNGPVLNGRLGSSPFHLQAAERAAQRPAASPSTAWQCALGRPTSPILFDAARLTGSFGGTMRGNFAGASATIGKVPLQLSDAAGTLALPQQGPDRRRRAHGLRPRPEPALLSAAQRRRPLHASPAT